jgi:hypothetical protein
MLAVDNPKASIICFSSPTPFSLKSFLDQTRSKEEEIEPRRVKERREKEQKSE